MPDALNTTAPSVKIANVNRQHHQQLTPADKIALYITDHIGTMGFFGLIFGWTIIWLGWNMLAPKAWKFDPAPAFVLWLFISNLIQLHLMPLLLIGQNIQGKHAELRSERDYLTDVRSETDVQAILAKLEQQQQLLETIQRQLTQP